MEPPKPPSHQPQPPSEPDDTSAILRALSEARLRRQIEDARDRLGPTEIQVFQLLRGLTDGRVRTPVEAASELGLTFDEVREIHWGVLRKLHPNKPLSPEREARSISRMRTRMRTLIDSAKDLLTADEVHVLELSLGLHDGRNWTYQEVAAELGRSQDVIQRLAATAMSKIAPPGRSEWLSSAG